MFKLSNRSISNLNGLHPQLKAFAEELIQVTPLDFVITCGVRTAEEQNALYQQGRTLPGSKITNCDGYKIKSNHQPHADGLGYAFDIAVLINNKINWNPENYKKVANAARGIMDKYSIEWGGDWRSFKDYPHFQLQG